MNRPTHITIRMTPEFKEMAKRKAEQDGVSLSALVKDLLKHYKDYPCDSCGSTNLEPSAEYHCIDCDNWSQY